MNRALSDSLRLALVWDNRALPVIASHVLHRLKTLPDRDHHQVLAGRTHSSARVSGDQAGLPIDEWNGDLLDQLCEFVGHACLWACAEYADDHVHLQVVQSNSPETRPNRRGGTARKGRWNNVRLNSPWRTLIEQLNLGRLQKRRVRVQREEGRQDSNLERVRHDSSVGLSAAGRDLSLRVL